MLFQDARCKSRLRAVHREILYFQRAAQSIDRRCARQLQRAATAATSQYNLAYVGARSAGVLFTMVALVRKARYMAAVRYNKPTEVGTESRGAEPSKGLRTSRAQVFTTGLLQTALPNLKLVIGAAGASGSPSCVVSHSARGVKPTINAKWSEDRPGSSSVHVVEKRDAKEVLASA